MVGRGCEELSTTGPQGAGTIRAGRRGRRRATKLSILAGKALSLVPA